MTTDTEAADRIMFVPREDMPPEYIELERRVLLEEINRLRSDLAAERAAATRTIADDMPASVRGSLVQFNVRVRMAAQLLRRRRNGALSMDLESGAKLLDEMLWGMR